MKKHYLVIMIIVFSLMACKQTVSITEDSGQYKGLKIVYEVSIVKIKDELIRDSYIVIKHDSTNKLTAIDIKKDGIQIGDTIADGNVNSYLLDNDSSYKRIREYCITNGKLQGKYRSWYLSGKKQYEKTYKEGVVDGVSREWDESGIQISSILYKNGVPQE